MKKENSDKDKLIEVEGKYSSQNIKRSVLKKQIIEIFYKEGTKTIAELRDLCNNSIPTLTAIMGELTQDKWTKKIGIADSKSGRRPAIYGINPTKGHFVSIRLSRRRTMILIYDMLNQPVSALLELKDGIDTSENILQIIKQEVLILLKEVGLSSKQILGYGITIPGLINMREGMSYSYPLLAQRPLLEIFGDLFEKPIIVEHDTKAMAIGELWFGLAKNKFNSLFVNVGSGIGLGQIINGDIYRGHTGYSGEFGHIQMDPDGELCYCGRIGCLETLASGTALVKKAKEEISKGKGTKITAMVNGNINNIKLGIIIAAAHEGDQFSIELLEMAGEHLAKAISILIHLYNPESIIIGGEMADAKQLLIGLIRQKLKKYTMPFLKKETKIQFSGLKESAGLMGVLPVIMGKVLSIYFDETN